MRICVLSIPRTGSQYLGQIISTNFRNTEELGEPFTLDSPFKIEVRNGYIRKCVTQHAKTIEENVQYLTNVFDKSDKQQSIFLKFFLVDNLEKHFSEVVENLRRNNFTFWVLRRNLEDNILSFANARKRNVWRQVVVKEYKKVLLDNFGDIEWIYKQNKLFDERLEKLNVQYETVHYETLISDVGRVLNTELNLGKVTLKKQLATNPYNYIENAEEVKNFIESLKNADTSTNI